VDNREVDDSQQLSLTNATSAMRHHHVCTATDEPPSGGSAPDSCGKHRSRISNALSRSLVDYLRLHDLYDLQRLCDLACIRTA
jgi:hypothetical protein